jgi:hypothetical protein
LRVGANEAVKKEDSFRLSVKLWFKTCVTHICLVCVTYTGVQTQWNAIQAEILPLLLPSYLASNATSSVVHELWLLNADLVMRTMVEMHSADPSTISRILDVCHELKVIIIVNFFPTPS